jgi:hypothetical protein
LHMHNSAAISFCQRSAWISITAVCYHYILKWTCHPVLARADVGK